MRPYISYPCLEMPQCGRRLSAPIPEAVHRAAATRSHLLTRSAVSGLCLCGEILFHCLRVSADLRVHIQVENIGQSHQIAKHSDDVRGQIDVIVKKKAACRSFSRSSLTICESVSVTFSENSRSSRISGSRGALRKSVVTCLTSSGEAPLKRRNSPCSSVQ